MRRAAKTDANHANVRDGLRQIPGCTVRDTSGIGGGFPDLVVGMRGVTLMLEVKDGAKAPSARKLTAAQQNFVENWTGSPIWVVESLQQAVDIVLREARS